MLLAQFQRLFLVLGGGAGGALKSGFRGGVMSGRAGSERVNFERKQQSLQLHGIIIIGSIEYHKIGKSLKAVKILKISLLGWLGEALVNPAYILLDGLTNVLSSDLKPF